MGGRTGQLSLGTHTHTQSDPVRSGLFDRRTDGQITGHACMLSFFAWHNETEVMHAAPHHEQQCWSDPVQSRGTDGFTISGSHIK